MTGGPGSLLPPLLRLREQKLWAGGVREGGQSFFYLPYYKNNIHLLVFGNDKSDEGKFSCILGLTRGTFFPGVKHSRRV